MRKFEISYQQIMDIRARAAKAWALGGDDDERPIAFYVSAGIEAVFGEFVDGGDGPTDMSVEEIDSLLNIVLCKPEDIRQAFKGAS